jgi:adenylate cyclase
LLRPHSFRVYILTLFLSLNLVAYLIIILFLHLANYKSIMKLSKGTTLRTAALVNERFKTIAFRAERLAQAVAGFVPNLGTLTPENKIATDFFLNLVKYGAKFSAIYVGKGDGGFLGFYSRADTAEKKFDGVPATSFYPKTAFLSHYINTHYSPPVAQWIFFNEEFKPIGKLTSTVPGYDVRLKPWYEGAKQARAPYWSEISIYLKGIVVSTPTFNIKGEVTNVVGANLSFSLLSNFLIQQKVGKTGRIFILDNRGKVVMPQVPKDSHVWESLITSVYQSYLSNPTPSHFIVEKNGVQYLTYIEELPAFTEKKWKLAILVPLKDFFGNFINIQKKLIWICTAIFFLSALIIIYFAKHISMPITLLAREILQISKFELDSKTHIKSFIYEIFMINQAFLILRRAIRSFASYVPKEVVRLLLGKTKKIKLGGEKREITILFSDISDFTTIMEEYPIDFLLPLIKEYFETMVCPILRLQGTIDKFLGDGIMAFWGAPIFFPDHAQKACLAVLHCEVAVNKINQKRKAEGNPLFYTRFALHTGIATVGNFGTEDRMNYTVIGDAVNTSARLQEVNRIYHTTILITQDVCTKLDASFITRPIDMTVVKGKKEKIKIYELGGKKDGLTDIQPSADKTILFNLFTKAYQAFEQGDLVQAHQLFLSIQTQFPDDYPTQLYLQRLEAAL